MKFSQGINLTICRRIPFAVAVKHKHQACAALLNPSSPEPLVWPSPLKLIIELDPDAKVLLEKALMDANMEREKTILKETCITPPCPLQSDVDIDADVDNDLALEVCILTVHFSFLLNNFKSVVLTHMCNESEWNLLKLIIMSVLKLQGFHLIVRLLQLIR